MLTSSSLESSYDVPEAPLKLLAASGTFAWCNQIKVLSSCGMVLAWYPAHHTQKRSLAHRALIIQGCYFTV